MKTILLTLSLAVVTAVPAIAQRGFATLAPGTPINGNPNLGYGGAAYGNPYVNPYATNGGWVPYGTRGFNNNTTYLQNGMAMPANFGAPQLMGNGYYGFNGGGYSYNNMWRGPSGYYYPWAYSPAVVYSPIINVQNGVSTPAQPPLSTIFSDMIKYLDEQKDKGKLSEADFTHLKRRALDLLSKERDLRTQSGGSLDTDAETQIRADIDSLGGEISRQVKL